MVRDGLTLEWKDGCPPLRATPWVFPLPVDGNKRSLLVKEVTDLLTKDAIEEVREARGYYSLIFLVPKKSGDWRPVFDLSNLNKFLTIPRFKMESAVTIQKAMEIGKWAVSIDIKDAYLHIPINKASRKFLKFAFMGKVYQFKVLPFGVANAPYVFTRVVRAMAAIVHARGIKFHHYIDDWLIIADTPQQAISHATFVLNLTIKLGWIPNWDKSQLTPSQTFEYVGVRYDLGRGLALPPVPRMQKTILLLNQLISHPVTTARLMLSLIGLLVSVEKQVPYGRCFLRPLQWCLASQWKILSQPLNQQIVVNERAIEACKWWLQPANHFLGMPLEAYKPQRTFFTDASLVAWGAHMDWQELSHRWTTVEQKLHINVLELKAVTLAFEHWGSQAPQGTTWLVFTDNTTVVAHINKQGGTRSLSLCLEAERLIRLTHEWGMTIKARHIPGKRNVLADALSRPDRVLGTEWSLCPSVFKQMCRVFGTPNIDLFATSRNTKLSCFISPLQESEAFATDAMSLSWNGMYGYAYPPVGFLTTVLQKIATSHCEIMLVAPCWPTQAWFPLLMSLLVKVPRVLPTSDRLLMQPGTSIFHESPQYLRLHVWRLSSDRTKTRDFLSRCPRTCLGETVSQLQQRIKPNGKYTFVGVKDDALIHSLPL